MSNHEGHRARMRERFLNSGLEGFAEHEALEMLLYHCIPRGDTNQIAHRLIHEFGPISQVFEASAEELMRVEGVGKNTATSIAFFASFCRYYYVKRAQESGTVLKTVNDCGKYLRPQFMGRRNEVVFMVCLDGKGKVLSCKMVGEGSVNSAGVPVRRIVELALGANATSVILAHNHPSGLAVPSGDDVQTTLAVARALKTVDIELTDHLVISNTDYVSMRESGYYDLRDVF